MAEFHRIIAEQNATKEAAAKETALKENAVTPSKNGIDDAFSSENEVKKPAIVHPLDGETGNSSSKRPESPQIAQEISDDSLSSDFSFSDDDDYNGSSSDNDHSDDNDYSGDNNYSNDDDNDDDDIYNRDAISDLFPMAENANPITKQVQKFLRAAYRRESRFWTQEMTKEFREVAPTLNYEIFPTTGKISNHHICRYANRGGHFWVRFWFLRVMFGPIACSRQRWFAKLAAERPWVLDEADEGVVPEETASILKSKTTTWTPRILKKETPTLDNTRSKKRKAAEPMKSSRPAKETKASGSKDNREPRGISRSRTQTRASSSKNKQTSQNASRLNNDISRPSNERSCSSNDISRPSNEIMATSFDNQQEFNLSSEVEIKLLKQKLNTLEQKIAQLESENRELKKKSEEFDAFKMVQAWKTDQLWKRLNHLEQILPEKE